MLFRWSLRGEALPATFPTTLVLLAALIAMVTQVIGDNVARAFSLVGALSVVRFRTVVKDTQDTAFVIMAALGRQRRLSGSTAKNAAALDLSYSVRRRSAASLQGLIGQFNGIAGVSGVELSRAG